MNKYLVPYTDNIRDAIKQIDMNGEGFVFVVDVDKKVKGILTDGDFRRAILKGISLEVECLEIANKNFKYFENGYSDRDIINCFLQSKIRNIPILENGHLISVLHRKDFDLSGKVVLSDNKENISIVIMAGGKGTRMKPFTNILPKPLIPIGDKSMLEIIMDEYNLYFKSDFYLSVNFKANLIKAYLEDFKELYQISYLYEDIPLGTGGSLKYMEGRVSRPFFVSNCDILIKANYNEIYESHIRSRNDLTIVASMVHYKVPYGVCEISVGGELKKLIEKPEYDFLVNAGMYIVNPETLKLIPDNQFYNITDFIEKIKIDGGKVGVFPVSEKSYHDTGQWGEYNNMLEMFNK